MKESYPNFRIDFLAGLQVLANRVFGLGDGGEFLAPVDVEALLGLAQVRSTVRCLHVKAGSLTTLVC